MATLSSKGKNEIGRIEGLTKTLAYFDNREILVNYGFGWKLYGKIKPDCNPAESYRKQINKIAESDKKRPFYAAYKKALIRAGHSKRSLLHTAIELMPDDPDGVWSETCDSYGNNLHVSIEDICELCKLYKLSLEESKIA